MGADSGVEARKILLEPVRSHGGLLLRISIPEVVAIATF